MNKIRGYHISPNAISDDSGKECAGNWVDYLFAGSFDDARVFYHLDASVAALLKHLRVPEQILEQLKSTGKCNTGILRFVYYPGSFFAIDRNGQSVKFYDMLPYRSNHGLMPEDGAEYCKGKAIEARDTAYAIMQVLIDLGLKIDEFGTPIKIFTKNILANCKFPTAMKSMPQEAMLACVGCVEDGGAWVETFKRGYFPEAYHFDKRSAYGESLAEVVDTRRGTWGKTTTNKYVNEALYGYLFCTVHMTSPFHPVQYRAKNNILSTPIGTWDRWINKKMYDHIKEYELGEVEIHQGYWYIPKGEQYQYLKGAVNWLFNKRINLEGLSKRVVGKIIQAMYGQSLHRKANDLGEFFNPQIAAECLTDATISISKTCLERGATPIGVHTDSIVTDVDFGIEDTKTLGCWRCDGKGRAISLGNSIICIEGLDHSAETSVNFSWLYDLLANNPDESEFEIEAPMPHLLAGSLITKQLDKLGSVEFKTKILSLHLRNAKRGFIDAPITGEGLLSGNQSSLPLAISGAENIENSENDIMDLVKTEISD